MKSVQDVITTALEMYMPIYDSLPKDNKNMNYVFSQKKKLPPLVPTTKT